MQTLFFFLILAIVCLFCFKGVPAPITGLFCGALLCLTMGIDVTEGLSTIYMNGFIGFVKPYWMMLLYGAIFGKIIEISGAADSLAKAVVKYCGDRYALIGLLLVTIILNAGGINTFVCLYTVFPIGLKICKEANLPRKYLMSIFTAGCIFASIVPGTPSINNTAPTSYLGTTVTAAFAPGLIVALINLTVHVAFIFWCKNRDAKLGRLYFTSSATTGSLENFDAGSDRKLPHPVRCLIPTVLVILSLNILKLNVNNALLVGIAASVVCLFPFLPHNYEDIRNHAGSACAQGMTAIINTSAIVGFGAIMQATPVFSSMMDTVVNLNVPPLFGAWLTTTCLAMVCGSSSSGIAMASPVLAEYYSGLASMEAMHRVAAIGSMGLDSLPNCGFLQTQYAFGGCTFREAYPQHFMISVVFNCSAGLLFILLAPIFGY